MLRIGVILEDDVVPFWVSELIKKTDTLPSTQLIKIRLWGTQKQPTGFLFKLFSRIDHAILPGKPSSLYVPGEFPAGTIEINVNGIEPDRLELDKIRACNPDIILHFSHSVLDKTIQSIPRLGTWSLLFSDSKLPFLYSGFWDWFYKSPVSSVAIVQQKEQAGIIDNIIARSDTRIDHLSLSRCQTLLFSRAIDLVLNTLNKVSIDPHFILPESKQPIEYHKKPGLRHMMVAIFKLLVRLTNKTLAKAFYIDQWVLFISISQNFPTFDFSDFKPIIPPKDRFWADPFVVSQEGKHFVFIEELPYKTKRGHLKCMVLNAEGKIEDSKIILEKPYHLSYPFIFSFQGQWFMIPESAENKTVDLYECVEFPFNWKFRRTLLKGLYAFDSTLHFTNDRIWLFCTIQQSEGGSPNDDLHLFSTNDLLEGKWTPHPQNPVVSDPCNARPAGKIFYYEGNLYRPSQVCVPRYGYALAINRIDQLNEKSYRETRITQNLPNWHKQLISNHTYNSSAQLTITDGQLTRLKFNAD